jgi:hypothetical protein
VIRVPAERLLDRRPARFIEENLPKVRASVRESSAGENTNGRARRQASTDFFNIRLNRQATESPVQFVNNATGAKASCADYRCKRQQWNHSDRSAEENRFQNQIGVREMDDNTRRHGERNRDQGQPEFSTADSMRFRCARCTRSVVGIVRRSGVMALQVAALSEAEAWQRRTSAFPSSDGKSAL